MMTGFRAVVLSLACVTGWSGLTAAEDLTHRVWVLDGQFSGLDELRAAGVDGLVVPVGDVRVTEDSCRLTLRPLSDLSPLGSWTTSMAVWVSGQGSDSGDADALLSELAPVRRLLGEGSGVIIVARAYWEGLPKLASRLAHRLGAQLEVVMPVQDLARTLPAGGWRNIAVTGVAFGNPEVLGFPAAVSHDDLVASAVVDGRGAPFRLAIVIVPRVAPPVEGGGASLAVVARPSVAAFKPGERGDIFTLREPVRWGGVVLQPGQTVSVEAMDCARYHHDLGLALRPVRHHLVGWDTVGLPAPSPTVGLSREAFVSYLKGGLPYPAPVVDVTWGARNRLDLAIANPGPQSSAVATAGNYVEVSYDDGQVLDAGLGEFSGLEYGLSERGAWRRAASREAKAVRFYFTYLAPSSRLAGAWLSFLVPPRGLRVRWVLRLGDGTQAAGGQPSRMP